MEKERFRVIPAVHLFLKKENKILLLLRQNTGHRDGEYGLIAGHIEPQESVQGCLIREALEEGGITLVPADLKFLHVFYNTKRDYINFFFLAENWYGEIRNMEPEKCAELEWFDMDNLPATTIPYIADMVKAYKQGEFFSENDFAY